MLGLPCLQKPIRLSFGEISWKFEISAGKIEEILGQDLSTCQTHRNVGAHFGQTTERILETPFRFSLLCSETSLSRREMFYLWSDKLIPRKLLNAGREGCGKFSVAAYLVQIRGWSLATTSLNIRTETTKFLELRQDLMDGCCKARDVPVQITCVMSWTPDPCSSCWHLQINPQALNNLWLWSLCTSANGWLQFRADSLKEAITAETLPSTSTRNPSEHERKMS